MALKVGCQARLWLRETQDLGGVLPTIGRGLGSSGV